MNKNIFEQQKRLQEEAKQIIANLDLYNVLSKVGNPVLVGSAALGLMTWKDIDFSILVYDAC